MQSNDIFLYVTGLAMWAYIGVIHLIYTQPMQEHLRAKDTNCKCKEWTQSETSSEFIGDKTKAYIEKVAREACIAMCPPETYLANIEAEKQRASMSQFKAS